MSVLEPKWVRRASAWWDSSAQGAEPKQHDNGTGWEAFQHDMLWPDHGLGPCILSKAQRALAGYQGQCVGDKKGRQGAMGRGDVNAEHLPPLDSGTRVPSAV